MGQACRRHKCPKSQSLAKTKVYMHADSAALLHLQVCSGGHHGPGLRDMQMSEKKGVF